MADIRDNTSSYTTSSPGDILPSRNLEVFEAKLTSIDNSLRHLVESDGRMSQSSARDYRDNEYDKAKSGSRKRSTSSRNARYKTSGNPLSDFTDGIEKAMLDALGAGEFKQNLQSSLNKLANQMGVSVQELPNAFGQELGKQMMGKLKSSDAFNKVSEKMSDWKDKQVQKISDGFNQGVARYRQKNGASPTTNSSSDLTDIASRSLQNTNTSSSSSASVDLASPVVEEALGSTTREVIGSALGAEGTAGAALGGEAMASMSTTALGAGGTAGAALGGEAMASIGTTALGAGEALAGMQGALMAINPEMLAVVAGLAILDSALELAGKALETMWKLATSGITESIDYMKESAESYVKSLSNVLNRDDQMARKLLKEKMDRERQDMEAITKLQYQIVEDSANKIMEVWDNTLSSISQAQGYNKAGVQDLMANYADRLRQEGLSSVVSGAEITENLAKVVDAGLSGPVAEEFAYLATVLGQAVPTQDWFSYASDYATVAALAMKEGASQQEALQYANAELETFASNVLYAGRSLAGGFSTGLQNASEMFASAVQIANASKIGDAASISGVLTAVSAVTSAISSDSIASSLVEAVTKAAIGGNSSDIVALRSLAGINASNTEFLQAFARDPQAIFTEVFKNLGVMQNMSQTNFMEVAEGLSEVFGVSMEALSQVDFSYLADAVSQMDVNTNSLDENMALLASGQSTTNAEQQRIAEINKQMIDEGLAYVLDNEAARAMQQHMWEEQLNNELMENTYAIDIQGDGLALLQSIGQTVKNVLDFLNPFSWLKKNIKATGAKVEYYANKAELADILRLGVVGKGNQQEFKNLTTTGTNLGLTKRYVELLGGTSKVTAARKSTALLSSAFTISPLVGVAEASNYLSRFKTANGSASGSGGHKVTSQYEWGTVTKSLANAVKSATMSAGITTSANSYVNNTSAESATEASAKAAASKLNKMMDEIQNYVKDNKSYDEWAADSKRFGIAKLADAIEAAGMKQSDIESMFQQEEAKAATQHEHEREVKEDEFWLNGNFYWTKFMPAYSDKIYSYDEDMIAHQETQIMRQDAQILNQFTMISNEQQLIRLLTQSNNTMNNFFGKYKEFYSAWIDYYINHTAYSRDTMSAAQAVEVQNAERSESGDAIKALAEALTANQVNLLDPTVQQNALLSQILLVAQTIAQNTNGISSNMQGGSIGSTIAQLVLNT